MSNVCRHFFYLTALAKAYSGSLKMFSTALDFE